MKKLSGSGLKELSGRPIKELSKSCLAAFSRSVATQGRATNRPVNSCLSPFCNLLCNPYRSPNKPKPYTLNLNRHVVEIWSWASPFFGPGKGLCFFECFGYPEAGVLTHSSEHSEKQTISS